MTSAKIYQGSTGVKIIVETGQDLSDADYVGIRVKKPSEVEVEWSGTAVGTTIEYVTQEGDLDEAGAYKIQAVVKRGNSVVYGETAILYVYPKFG